MTLKVNLKTNIVNDNGRIYNMEAFKEFTGNQLGSLDHKDRNDFSIKHIAYKVVEEVLSPSGRVEYRTLPMYKQISEEEALGHKVFNPEQKGNIHSFETEEEALDYMKDRFYGYTYTRPVIFLVEVIGECETSFKEFVFENGTKKYRMNVSDGVKFIRPIYYMVSRRINEYSPMSKPEKKKKGGFVYDESEITGDTDYSE